MHEVCALPSSLHLDLKSQSFFIHIMPQTHFLDGERF